METWLGEDGRTLMRAGRGRVTAVVPQSTGSDSTGSTPAVVEVFQVNVEIEVAVRPGQARAIRVLVHGLVESGSALHRVAQDTHAAGSDVDWTIRWVRHSWVPEDIPIQSLRLSTDTTAYLDDLVPVDLDKNDDSEAALALEAELQALIDAERP